ncbi:MAG: amidohydrolase family protein [Ignavibacteriales bacterium]|nr:amidohydrolase family protein [Ignavibacteriales bacterium]
MIDSIKIIENGFVFTGDTQNRAGKLTLIIQNGRIIEVGKRADALKATYPNAEVIDAAGKIILPGFVDAHHTGESFILHYLTSGQPMARWNKNPLPSRSLDYVRKEATFQEFLTLYRLSYYAALKSGVTTLAEYGLDNPEHSFPASFEAMQQTNQRGFIGLHNGDQIEAARKLRESSIRFAFVIADEENLTTYNLQSSIRSARELQWPIILHLGQTRQAFNIVKKNFNKSIAQLYAEYGAIDSPVHLLHLSCFDEGDYEIIVKSRAPLVYSPSAILQKGTEMPPFGELLKHKITLALGTDWGSAQPLENIHSYCSILKTLSLPQEQAYRLLALHTKNGAYALGLDADIGTIETGKKADLVFLDLSEFRLNAILADKNAERILEVVLQEAGSQQVSDVMINGEFYIRERHVLTYSEEDLAREAQSIFKKLLSLTEEKTVVQLSPATILQFPAQQKNESTSSADEMVVEEGFRIVRKERTKSAPQTKDISSTETGKELPKNVKKIFGDDEA